MRLPVFLAALLVAFGTCLAAHKGEDEPVSAEAIDRAISLATQYIAGACGADGKFVYEINTGTGRVSPDYNIIRHAGAMYALAMAHGWRPQDHVVMEALERAAAFLRANDIRPGPRFDGAKTLAIWSAPAGASGSGTATLGATGLGLVGLLGCAVAKPDTISREDLEGLGRFLLFLQKKDGEFHSKYLAGDGKFAKWGSLYYPGEAALGLVSLHEWDGTKKWLTASRNALLYLAGSRAGATDIPADHWALIATAKLFALRDSPLDADDRNLLVAHAVQICESILAEQIDGPGELAGGFKADGRTTPTSTRLEGLLATLEFLPPARQELRSRIEKAASRGIQFLLGAQIQKGRYAGGVPQAIPRSGNTDAPVIRIDYVQHFLCALIRYRKSLAAPAPTPAELRDN